MDRYEEEEASADRERLARLLDLRAEECYRALLPYSRAVATGVLSSLLSAAEKIRGGVSMGEHAVDLNIVVDSTFGRVATVYLQAHRETPHFKDNSPPLAKGRLADLLRALRIAERANINEQDAILRALTPEIELWLSLAAEQALATATEEERELWRGRYPLEVAAELLVGGLRRLLREIGEIDDGSSVPL